MLAIKKQEAPVFQALATNVWFENTFHRLVGKVLCQILYH